ncbi:hypothetical protein GCM10010341_10730 [Streptomyces noursei]|nr:hypothetical protein GCM10010341_10730 [Streptomyces noursei]
MISNKRFDESFRGACDIQGAHVAGRLAAPLRTGAEPMDSVAGRAPPEAWFHEPKATPSLLAIKIIRLGEHPVEYVSKLLRRRTLDTRKVQVRGPRTINRTSPF